MDDDVVVALKEIAELLRTRLKRDEISEAGRHAAVQATLANSQRRLEDSQKHREDSERFRLKIKDETEQRQRDERTFREHLLAQLERHNTSLERLNVLMAQALEALTNRN